MKTKKAKVVMLPTKQRDDYTPIGLDSIKTIHPMCHLLDDSQHLYIISDDKIKEGDWCLDNIDNNYRFQVDKDFIEDNPNLNHYCKKIIATTDKSLTINNYSDVDRLQDFEYKLPQIPQSFIEESCKVSGIDEVLVEYDDGNHTVECGTKYRGCSPDCTFHNNEKLKIDSNNNINILPIKDNWNREEVETLLYKAINDTNLSNNRNVSTKEDDWIKENLK